MDPLHRIREDEYIDLVRVLSRGFTPWGFARRARHGLCSDGGDHVRYIDTHIPPHNMVIVDVDRDHTLLYICDTHLMLAALLEHPLRHALRVKEDNNVGNFVTHIADLHASPDTVVLLAINNINNLATTVITMSVTTIYDLHVVNMARRRARHCHP